MSPVVIVGFSALDAALIGQAVYACSDWRRRETKADRKEK